MTHRSLHSLLAPDSIAVVGASNRPDSIGWRAMEQVRVSGFLGSVHAVNPKYQDVAGFPCVPSLEDLEAAPEHIVLAVPNESIESEVRRAIRIGSKSATIFASCYLAGDSAPPLTERLRKLCDDAGFLLCGANCLGFYNLEQNVRSSWYPYGALPAGRITAISHSGSVFVSLGGLDPRLRFNLLVSAGQELNVTTADYMAYALERPSTRVIVLFLEAVRDPAGFTAALDRANSQNIPVIALKVGRTAMSAELSRSHSGAIAGNDAAYEALFRHYGVTRVSSLDELAATALVLGHTKRISTGRGIAAVHDSGGERSMAIDLAASLGVPYAEIGAATTAVLSAKLDYGLAPVNPLDLWGTGNNFENIFHTCFSALMMDPDTAAGILFSDIGRGGVLDAQFADAAIRVADSIDKPLFIAQNLSRTLRPDWLGEVTQRGTPVLDGTENALLAVRHALAYRDFCAQRSPIQLPTPPAQVVQRWRDRLCTGASFTESEVLQLFADFDVPVPAFGSASSLEDALQLALTIGFPVVLKTATPGILHKSDVDGVRLNIRSEVALRAAYQDVAGRLGPEVLIAAMCEPGTELALGLVADAQFGSLMVVASGGIFMEIFKDRQVALPPIGAGDARRLVDLLRARPLLDGVRGRPASDIEKLCLLIARFSQIGQVLGDLIAELDANPIIAGPSGAWAVDGLLVPQVIA